MTNVPKKLFDAALAISVQRIPRLADARPGRGTEKTGRSDTFTRKKLELLFGAQRSHAGRNVGKENRPPAENLDCCIDGILVLLGRVPLFWSRRIRKIFLLWILLSRSHRSEREHEDSKAQHR